jgi:iron complex transport system permease protein
MKKMLLPFALLLLLSSPFFGEIPLIISDLFLSNSLTHRLFFELRLPRLLLAFFVGGTLALGGLVFQVLFRNPISTPFTLGVASGATLFSAIATLLGLIALSWLFAFVGAVSTVLILYALSHRLSRYDTASLLLIGIALSLFYSSALMVIFYLSTLQESYEIVRFTMGSLDIVGFAPLYLIVPSSLLVLWIIFSHRHTLRLLLISHEFAHLKGINLQKSNYLLLFTISLGIGVGISFTGPIGFVGLIIPHILRQLYQQSSDRLILPSFFYGGVFLVVCDLIGRTLSLDGTLPIGVVTSFLGTPFFIYLLLRGTK